MLACSIHRCLPRPFEAALAKPLDHIGSHPAKLERLVRSTAFFDDDGPADRVVQELARWRLVSGRQRFTIFVIDSMGESASVAIGVLLYHSIREWSIRTDGDRGMPGTMVHLSHFHWAASTCEGDCDACGEMTSDARRAPNSVLAEAADMFGERAIARARDIIRMWPQPSCRLLLG